MSESSQGLKIKNYIQAKRSLLTKITISFFLVILVLGNFNCSDLVDLLKLLDLKFFILISILNIATVYLNSIKLHIFFRNTTVLKIFNYSIVSYLFAFFLPGQVGQEGYKIYALGNSRFIETIKSSAYIILDKYIGFTAMLALGILGFFASQDGSALIPLVILIVFCCLFLVSILLIFGGGGISFFRALRNKLLNFRVMRLVLAAIILYMQQTRRLCQNKKIIIINFLYSIASQLVSISIPYYISIQLGLEITFLDWCWLSCILTIALFLPLSVAGIGVRELTLIGLLSVKNVSISSSVTISLLLGFLYLELAIIGCFILFCQKKTS
jgi:glycosyltransferase 2 family protein